MGITAVADGMKFGPDLLGGVGVACRELFSGLPEVRESLLVVDDLECLQQGLALRHGTSMTSAPQSRVMVHRSVRVAFQQH